ncbi:hypothetical protein [Runella slithyformis]|uniref:Glycosyltransferase family 4 protein n=1 Tax=Runella slithyformis (strain ATCC 29530 / DSM 19594 / LMG 11500 / NCIMB 11436 / LSU 4) TaxID=761193 RepID=A0A7U3ZKJ7_RUNSL|nr:hypothetical protein [Runella slithyformis]AEI48932.1 hypothetical protein Runsl_2528 [Runella slithyformis DSM 19594]
MNSSPRKPLSLTIVNRHYPPNPGITGESAWDLTKYLIEHHGIDVRIVHVRRSDLGGGQIRLPIGKTFQIGTLYKGNKGILKLAAGFFDGFFLMLKTLQVRRGPVLCMTSPPLLPFWASWLLPLFGIRWGLWSMDLFPEGFVADGVIKESNPVYRFVRWITYRFAPSHLFSLGPNQAVYIQKKYGRALPATILPCGVLLDQPRDPTPPEWRKEDGKIYFGYAGNLGDAHSSDFLLAFIHAFDPQKHHLILALYGTKSEAVLKVAAVKEGITLLKNVPRSQLSYIDVHLVSLLPKWTHIAVPSKAVSSVCAGGAILFCGSKEADTWAVLQRAGWYIDETGELTSQLNQFLSQLTPEEAALKQTAATQLAIELQKTLQAAYEDIATFCDCIPISKNY